MHRTSFSRQRRQSHGIKYLGVGLLLAVLSSAFSNGTACAAPRVVTLAPSLTDMVEALNRTSLLAGRASEPDAPATRRALPETGPYNRPSLEKIAYLRPDLCLSIADGTPPSTAGRLEKMGIRVKEFRIRDLEDLRASFLELGRLLEAEEEAAAVITDMDARLAAIDKKRIAQKKHPRVLFLVQGTPMIAASGHTFAGALLSRSGAENALPDHVEGYPVLSKEMFLHLAPDIVLDVTHGGLPALPPGIFHGIQVLRMDPQLFARPSLKSLDALDILVHLW